MGYTHYWERVKKDHNSIVWKKFVKDCIELSKLSHLYFADLGDATGEKTKPEFSNTHICFNGLGADAHETFILSKVYKKQKYDDPKEAYQFGFCKTARKPYDIMVCACLILYKYHFPTEVWISSDGGLEEDEWKDALLFTLQTLPEKEADIRLKLFDPLLEDGILFEPAPKND